MNRLLLFGYGNPSRGDDALGPALLDLLQGAAAECLTDFQLQVEHALDLQQRDLVLFVDASVSCPPPFAFTRLRPARDASFTTHAVSPAAVLEVYQSLQRQPPPPSYLLSIRGVSFELGDGLSAAARDHLAAAHTWVERLLAQPDPESWETLRAAVTEIQRF